MQAQVHATGVAHAVDLGDPDLAAALDVAEREVIRSVPLLVEAGDAVDRSPSEVAAGPEPSVDTRAGRSPR